MELKGRVFVVSGGGSGLGAATVARLVNEGARVVIADIDVARGTAVAERLGGAALFQRTDVVDEASLAAAIAAGVDRFGRIDGAVGCAGVALAERLVGREGPHMLDHFRRVIEVNLIGMFNLMRLTAAQLVDRVPDPTGERGVLIATASIAAFDGQVGQAAYAASKGGIVGMTLPIARDLARHGIRMMTIAPGIFDTPILEGLPGEVRTQLGAQVPFPSRLGQPEEFAALVVHIIQNQMLNGEVIRLDGALRMPPR